MSRIETVGNATLYLGDCRELLPIKSEWIVEMDCGGINWIPLAYCFSHAQANALVQAPHVASDGRPVRIRKYGEIYRAVTV